MPHLLAVSGATIRLEESHLCVPRREKQILKTPFYETNLNIAPNSYQPKLLTLKHPNLNHASET